MQKCVQAIKSEIENVAVFEQPGQKVSQSQKLVQGDLELLILEFRIWSEIENVAVFEQLGQKVSQSQKLVQGDLELLILEFRIWSQSWCSGLGQKTSTAWAPLRVTSVLESEVWLVPSRFRVGTKSWYSLVFEQVTKKYQLRRRLACGRMEFGRCCDKWWKYWEHLEEKY